MINTLIVLAVSVQALFCAIPAGSTYTNSNGIQFKRIPTGIFKMGFEGDRLPSSIAYGQYGDTLFYGMYDEKPACSVSISRDFYMGATEVTIGQYKQYNPNILARYAGSSNNTGDAFPVAFVTWAEADSFCQWLTANDDSGYYYRLPTEAEWEYCCRAGTTTLFFTGNTISSDYYISNAGDPWDWRPNWVGSKTANPWGLYDMVGNLEEWCLDYYGPYTSAAKTNPGGYLDADFKVTRSMNANSPAFGPNFAFVLRSAVRGGNYKIQRQQYTGFRVVMTELTKDSLSYLPAIDTLAEYQKNVTDRPAPGSAVSGETYADTDGREFRRVRMVRDRSMGLMFTQLDSIVYVSTAQITDTSIRDRKSAGLFVQALAAKFNILYRISNKYEIACAGINAGPGDYYLTIIPDIRYDAGSPHPDVAYYQERRMQYVPRGLQGPIYSNWNPMTFLAECPNGDVLVTCYTDLTEDDFAQNAMAARLKRGENAWGVWSPLRDVPGRCNYNPKPYIDEQGRMAMGDNGGFPFWTPMAFSTDNGVHWSRPVHSYRDCINPLVRRGGDTLVVPSWDGYLYVSTNNGVSWSYRKNTSVNHGIEAFHHVFLDDGSSLMITRGGVVGSTAGKWTTADLGLTWGEEASPFAPPGGPGNHTGLIKLFSGRILLMSNIDESCNPFILGESVDNGKTWFVRRNSYSIGYVDIVQGRDGIIHAIGDDRRSSGDHAQFSFSEQWLRETACRDVSTWGVNTPGTLTDCSDADNTEPAYFDSVPSTVSGRTVVPISTLHLSGSPNPFNPLTTLQYQLGIEGNGLLEIYRADGKCVQSFEISGRQGEIHWNGAKQGSGIYLCRLTTPAGKLRTLRMALIK